MEQFLNEALRTGKGIELGDALKVGGMVTGVGLGIVFGVLLILMVVLILFKVIFYRPEGKKQTAKTAEKVKADNAPAVAAQKPEDSDELIAVITAAVAASLNTSTYNLKIKSIRRVEGKSPAWNKAGLRDVLDSRY